MNYDLPNTVLYAHSSTRHRLPNLAVVKFGSVLESDDTADDRTVVIAPIPLQHKYPIQPSNEADMQDALIAAHLLHIILQLAVIGPGLWIAHVLGRGLADCAYWLINRMNCGIERVDL